MDNKAAPEGSIWRRWDLHIHTPGTKLNNAYGSDDDATWNRFIDELETSSVQVFGITDYFCCDSYFKLKQRYSEKYPETEKIFFLNVEFRLSESISADGSHPDIHVIFDNDEDNVNQKIIGRFLTNLETQAISDANVKTRCSDLKAKAEFMAATVSLDNLLKALEDTFGDDKLYLIVFPANNNGLRSTDSNSPRKVSLADRIDRTCDVFFGNANNREFLLKKDRYRDGESEPKPVVSGSDAHSFDDLERFSGDVAGYPSTWIKADATFFGLTQICHEPESRVFIGSEPEVKIRQDQDGTKFLGRLQISQIEEYDESNGRWFKSVDLPINPELTAIIGNKGSGKSAILDIIGLLGDSRQEDYFSFLTDDSKSKKFRQRGFAENFVAKLIWRSGKLVQKSLSDNCDPYKPEAIEYLPQNYFEQLTNEIEIEQFRSEIEDVVFSHVEETERLGKSSFSELEESKTLQCKEEISTLKRQIRELNYKIVDFEKESSPKYRKQVCAQIQAKKEELAALNATKPKEVAKPDTETDEQRSIAAQVDKLSTLLSTLNNRVQERVSETTALKSSMQLAVSLKDRLNRFNASMRKEIEELDSMFRELNLHMNDIVSVGMNFAPIDGRINEFQEKIAKLERDTDLVFTIDSDFTRLDTIPDLRNACGFVKNEISLLKEQLSTPQRRYQAFVERLGEWESKRKTILGDEEKPQNETLNWLKDRLDYIDNMLAKKLESCRSKRNDFVKKVYNSKSEFLQFYRDLKASVDERLQAVRTKGFEIEIEASFVVDRDFRREFLNKINQRKRGPYKNSLEAEQLIGLSIQETDWDNLEAIIAFIDKTIGRMEEGDLLVSEQAHDTKGFYDYLYSLDYLSSRYELRLGGKNLNELSPGEKGLLLLIFYLQLDRKNTPLVIDQPEDNLDNESIFSVLANCIREAKKRRQVILVTHNPNLAVGADAEQIVYVRLEKSKNYKFSYESGSIENNSLNQRIVDVLEGSQPAFVKRRLKYGIR